nr:MAG TPA: chaperone [Caudoviricetes sp.]
MSVVKSLSKRLKTALNKAFIVSYGLHWLKIPL